MQKPSIEKPNSDRWQKHQTTLINHFCPELLYGIEMRDQLMYLGMLSQMKKTATQKLDPNLQV